MIRRRRAFSPFAASLFALLSASHVAGATNALPIANAGSDRTGTVNVSLTLSGSGSYDPDGSIAAYWWTFGDGGSVTTTSASISHTYTAAGTYVAVLWVRDNAGAWSATNDAASVSITSGTATTTTTTLAKTTTTLASDVAPVANAGPNQATQSLLAVTFNGGSSYDPDGSIMLAQWAFGDGATAGGLVASHSYATPGSYTATLTVVDNGGRSASDTAAVSVANRAPIANAGADTSGAPGVAVTLDGSGSYDPDGTITAWAWTFGDGATGTGMKPTHAYASAGTYSATLTVTDDKGARASDSASVTIAVTGGSVTTWSHSIGGTNVDSGSGIVGDAAGNTYVGGTFQGTINVGGTSLTSAGGNDWFLVKYSGAGNVVWAKRFGGTGEDLLDAVALGPDGNVVATGRCGGSASFGGATFVTNGSADMVVAKYAGATGAHLWSKQFGGVYDDAASAVAVDPSNNVVFTGYFRGTVNFGGGPLVTPYGSDLDVFVAKLSSTGAYVWAKHFTNTGNERGYGIATDANGNVVVGGYFSNAVDFGGGSLVSGNAMTDAFVARFTASGAYSWARRFGASDGNDGIYGVATDTAGNVVVAGYAVQPIDLGGGLLAALGGSDGFVAKYAASSGAHQWSRRLGGVGNDYAYGVAVDGSNNVYVTGAFGALASFGGGSLNLVGGSDAFVAKYSSTGAALWAKGLGGIGDDLGHGIGISANAPVVTGYFYSSGNFNGTTLSSAGLADAFAVRMNP